MANERGERNLEKELKLTLGEDAADALAVFCGRVTYDDAYLRASGATEEKRKAMAYRILAAVAELKGCLLKA